MTAAFERDVVIVGGCGHVGLPLSLVFADRGLRVAIYDVDEKALALVQTGELPFDEKGGLEVLSRVLGVSLMASSEASIVSTAETVIVVTGTPIDEHMSPDPSAVPNVIRSLAPHLRDGQLLVLRSTLFPGVTALVEREVERLGKAIDVAYCPERIAEGRAMTELFEIPQLIASRSEAGFTRAESLFGKLTDKLRRLDPEEAELAKLFTNVWRYIRFATANQLYMIANDHGLDYERIRQAVTYAYPRASGLPGAGFTAGPCLLKDAMHLAAFNNNNFTLGHASMMVNEGLPLYVVSRLEQYHDLSSKVVGILGMAFKAESDDIRSSLSYKLKKILQFRAAGVLSVCVRRVAADRFRVAARIRRSCDLGDDRPLMRS